MGRQVVKLAKFAFECVFVLWGVYGNAFHVAPASVTKRENMLAWRELTLLLPAHIRIHPIFTLVLCHIPRVIAHLLAYCT